MNRLLFIPLVVCVGCADRTVSDATTTPPPVTDSKTAPAPTATATPTAPSLPHIQGPKLLPVDEGASDPSFVAFRAELLAAVRARDLEKVIALSDPDVRTSFGGDGGAAGLRTALSRPDVWPDLEQLLTLGGSFRGEGDQRSFWAPYVYSAWPESEDAFESLAVIGVNVPLHATSGSGAPATALLSHDIVRRASGPGVNVKTADGRTGWVEPKQLRSPVGYRAGFMRRNGQWRMNALVAGD